MKRIGKLSLIAFVAAIVLALGLPVYAHGTEKRRQRRGQGLEAVEMLAMGQAEAVCSLIWGFGSRKIVQGEFPCRV